MSDYLYKKIEKKWQDKWNEDKTYTTNDSQKPKQYILDMFPYPSGEGLHVGHPRGYIATDIYSRFKRMQGFEVLHPMGWDAFGLPAENFAIQNKVHPKIAVEKNIARFKEQLSVIGFDYDWSREIDTTDPSFYKWTQWIFLHMFKKGLAYESYEPINWCPSCQTGLANEDVEADGTCERCGTTVEKKPMRQWVLKITDYADRLLTDLDKLPKWPEGVKEAQRHWIGKTSGAEIDFPIQDQPEHPIKIFTTRPDTLFGATFVGISAELAQKWISVGWKASTEIQKYITESITNRVALDFKETEKTGIYAGFEAMNPATKEMIPVWITNYVLSDVGTGAIMGVPAHDERDFEFAKKYNLPCVPVVAMETGQKREDEIFKDGGAGIVFDPQQQKYAVAKWRDNGRVTFLAGGKEEDETAHEATLREVKQESGLFNFREIHKLGVAYPHFYNEAKNLNRFARAEFVLIILENSEMRESIQEPHENFELVWMTAEEINNAYKKQNSGSDYEHYLYFLHQGVAKAIELGYDTTSNREIFFGKPFCEDGILEDSGTYTGLSSEEARKQITEAVGGKIVTKYKIKDWVFSRQRYWGEPIPIIHCEKCGIVAVPEKDLPVTLPDVANYEPSGTGESPLANIPEWVNVPCPECGGSAKRETNTMPQWAGSSWYYLRYIDSKNNNALINPRLENEWMPIDVYVGGDHATRHLIYARFWHKFLFDIGVVSTEEPFPRLEFLGFILAEDGRKMSKRWKNVINPDEMVERFGADAFRLYEMFIGPFENTVRWNTDGMVGTYRFLERIWKKSHMNFATETAKELDILLHKTIKKVSGDIAEFKFNTAVSAMMILVNEIEKQNICKEDFLIFLKLLAPFAPHITEELWHRAGEKESIHLSSWPLFDTAKTIDENVTIAIQINGKVRDEITIPLDMNENEVRKLVEQRPKILELTAEKQIQKFIYVQGRIISMVVH